MKAGGAVAAIAIDVTLLASVARALCAPVSGLDKRRTFCLQPEEVAAVKELIGEAIKQIEIKMEPIETDTTKVTAKEQVTNKERPVQVGKISKQRQDEQKAVALLYYRSMGYYRTGQYELARTGFIKVVNSSLIPVLLQMSVNAIMAGVQLTSDKPFSEIYISEGVGVLSIELLS